MGNLQTAGNSKANQGNKGGNTCSDEGKGQLFIVNT